MPLINSSKVFRIDHTTDPEIVEGEWYELREEWSWSQIAKTRIDQAMSLKISDDARKGIQSGDVEAVSQAMDFGFDTSEVNTEKLKIGIIKWSHRQDGGGAFIPINGQTVNQLDHLTFQTILKHLNAAIARSKARGQDNGPLSKDSAPS